MSGRVDETRHEEPLRPWLGAGKLSLCGPHAQQNQRAPNPEAELPSHFTARTAQKTKQQVFHPSEGQRRQSSPSPRWGWKPQQLPRPSLRCSVPAPAVQPGRMSPRHSRSWLRPSPRQGRARRGESVSTPGPRHGSAPGAGRASPGQGCAPAGSAPAVRSSLTWATASPKRECRHHGGLSMGSGREESGLFCFLRGKNGTSPWQRCSYRTCVYLASVHKVDPRSHLPPRVDNDAYSNSLQVSPWVTSSLTVSTELTPGSSPRWNQRPQSD